MGGSANGDGPCSTERVILLRQTIIVSTVYLGIQAVWWYGGDEKDAELIMSEMIECAVHVI